MLLTNGMKAPDIEMAWLANGTSERLSDYAGKIIVLEFWATWCEPCQPKMADLQTYSGNYPQGHIPFKRPMAKVPTITGYSPVTGAVNNVRDSALGGDRGITSNVNVGDSMFQGFITGNAAATNTMFQFHYTADTGW